VSYIFALETTFHTTVRNAEISFNFDLKDYRRFDYSLYKDILSRTECILSDFTLQLKLIYMDHFHGFRIQVEIRQALCLSSFQLKLIGFLTIL